MSTSASAAAPPSAAASKAHAVLRTISLQNTVNELFNFLSGLKMYVN